MIEARHLAIVFLIVVGMAAPAVVLFGGQPVQSEFSASQRLGDNRIDTARLDIEVGQTLKTAEAENMAPGDRRLLEIELLNVGSLPLLFSLRVQPDGSALTSAMTWEQWIGSCQDDRSASPGNADLSASGIPIEVGGVKTACFAVGLPIDAPNSLQGDAATYRVVVDAEHDLDRS